MDFKKIKIISVIMMLFILVFGTISNADMGPKPSITLKLENIDSDQYLIDFLTDFNEAEGKKDWYNSYEYYYDYGKEPSFKEEPIYLYNDNGWMATTLRDGLLWGSIQGNEERIHEFTYFGVPNVFKIIIQMPDGSLKVSETIKRNDFNARYVVDVETMEVIDGVSYFEKGWVVFNDVMTYVIPAIVTVIVELLIAKKFMELTSKNKLLIIFTNLITNILLQLALVYINTMYVDVFSVGEIVVILVELILYLMLLEKTEKKKVIIYTILANIVTAFLTTFSIIFFSETLIPMIKWLGVTFIFRPGFYR